VKKLKTVNIDERLYETLLDFKRSHRTPIVKVIETATWQYLIGGGHLDQSQAPDEFWEQHSKHPTLMFPKKDKGSDD
jgi:hypothetical protein